MNENTIRIEWNSLCPKCRKTYVKTMLPKVRRYMREHPKTSMRRISRHYGIPHSTLNDALKRKVK